MPEHGETGRDDNGHAYVVVNLGFEILEELPAEECPTCGHMSVGCAVAALTMNGRPQHVGIFKANCAEGCDDEPILATHDNCVCGCIEPIEPDDD